MAQDPLSAFLGAKERGLGIQRQEQALSQSRQMAPTQQAMADVQLERQRQASTMAGDQRRLQGAELLKNVITKVKQIPDVNQRFEVMQRVRPELQKFGVEMPDFGVENLTDEGLQPLEAGLTGFVSDPASQLSAGEREFRSLSKDLTPEQQERARRIKLGLDPRATGSAAITTATTEGLTEQVAESKQEIKESEERGKGIAKTERLSIDEGRDAAKGIPVLKRTLQLLDQIKTGGFSAALIKAKQSLGVEGADEGELSANLGQAVLGDLRATFGAAFTEKEGARLEKIRANLGRSAVANRRLVSQALQIAEAAANRAIDDAIDAGDIRTAEEIQSLLDLELETGPAEAAQNEDVGVIMIDANGNRARVFKDGTFEELP